MNALHGELARRVHVDSTTLDWTASPGGEVQRKRLHRVGPAESGQVTSIVRYEPGARFPRHPHPGGEEILVLDGVFSDERGDYPAGSFLLNPEGFGHAPYSTPGCLLWVKLRQYPGEARAQVALNTNQQTWISSVRPGVHWKKLYAQEGFSDHMRIERWTRPDEVGELNFGSGAELLVLGGEFEDRFGHYGKHSWLRLPPGSSLKPRGSQRCELYIKEGGFAYLWEAEPEAGAA